ncbi:DUF6544 family protein [Algiphilus sp.]|uniref:DUF6544 family protein n=1 Tax=Algiphilus sp. TaxID=1872431 RepID=UPI003C36C8A6
MLIWLPVPLLAAVAALLALRACDARDDRAEWRRLLRCQPADDIRFEPAEILALPEPARRYFTFAIAPGTRLRTVAEIRMGGRFGMGTRFRPGYRAMRAEQVLATPHGFVWRMRNTGLPWLSGSDSGHWTRFRLFGLLPVARLGGTRDHARSAFGRHVAEAVLWCPAALLPRFGARWEATGTDTARITLGAEHLEQAVDITVDGDGRPLSVRFARWSNANPERAWRLQPFGALPDDFREVAGYRLPFRVDAGNQFGTPDYFPFFRAEVRTIRFPEPPGP